MASLRPSPPVAEPADAETMAWFRRELSLEAKIEKLRTSSTPPFGHFRASTNGHTYFVKVLAASEEPIQALADDLAAHCVHAGAPTMTAVRFVRARSGPIAYFYPFQDFRYGLPTSEDAIALGHALAMLHLAMRSYPQARRIETASKQRMRALAERRESLLQCPLGPDPERLRQVLSEAGPLDSIAQSQVIHGDLNIGNVGFVQQTGAPVFLDFETAAVSWLNPLLDIAMVLQRMILVADVSLEQKNNACTRLLQSYASKAECGPITGQALAAAMLWLSARNLCLLAELGSAGRPASDAEWQKFLDLAALARASEQLLDQASQRAIDERE